MLLLIVTGIVVAEKGVGEAMEFGVCVLNIHI